MPKRTRPLTPWGKEVKKKMIDLDLDPDALVRAVRAKGLTFDKSKLSRVISGEVGQKSPELIAAIDSLLGIPADVVGRPA